MNKLKKIKPPRILVIVIAAAVAAAILYIAISNLTVILSTSSQIISQDEDKRSGYDCILVLGAGVREDGSPSHMLADRLDYALLLYNAGFSNKILVSGDHGRVDYDEVNTMKDYLIERGVPSSDIFMDHAGFSTYDSIYRAKEIFLCEKIIIVTQKYHLYRALYIANRFGLEADGVASDPREYSGQIMRDAREVAARSKDFLSCIFKPKPKYLGESIPVSGDGNITNDCDSTR